MLRLLMLAARLTAREPARAWLMARMAVCTTALSALVKIVPLSRALKIISTDARLARECGEDELEKLSSAIDSLLATQVLMLKPSCWKRAAVLHRYLALKGVPTSIVFGVLKDSSGELKGHAWLERNGQPLLETPGPSYTVTYKFPSREASEIRLEIIDAAG